MHNFFIQTQAIHRGGIAEDEIDNSLLLKNGLTCLSRFLYQNSLHAWAYFGLDGVQFPVYECP